MARTASRVRRVIPRRAIFYWEGPEMSWLRRASVESFRRLNPDWEIVMLSSSDLVLDLDSRRTRAIRSDYARYVELSERGGIYFDTDIVFVRPIPKIWLEYDLVACYDDRGAICHVATLGASPRNGFFALAVRLAEKRLDRQEPLDYQALGIKLFRGNGEKPMSLPAIAREMNLKYLRLPMDVFLPVKWYEPEKLFSEDVHLDPQAVGIHWFGGDELVQDLEPRLDPDTLRAMNCLLGKALGL